MESSQCQILEDMCNIIKTLLDMLNKLELENKNSQRPTLYAVDEDELGIEGEEYEYDEIDAIHDENKIDEYWEQFFDFMQIELHKRYDLRLRKRSRSQENKSEQQV